MKKRAQTHTAYDPYLDFKSRFDEKLFGVVRLKSNHSVISLDRRCFYFILFFAFSPSTRREWNVLSMEIEMDWDQSWMQAQNASFIFTTGLSLYRSQYRMNGGDKILNGVWAIVKGEKKEGEEARKKQVELQTIEPLPSFKYIHF